MTIEQIAALYEQQPKVRQAAQAANEATIVAMLQNMAHQPAAQSGLALALLNVAGVATNAAARAPIAQQASRPAAQQSALTNRQIDAIVDAIYAAR
jgi:hypothetical protein